MTSSIARTTLTILVSLLMMAAVPAVSQTEETDPALTEDEAISEVITVTARQQEEALQDVPATVSVLTDSQIEAVGVQRAEDFIKLAPGVSI